MAVGVGLCDGVGARSVTASLALAGQLPFQHRLIRWSPGLALAGITLADVAQLKRRRLRVGRQPLLVGGGVVWQEKNRAGFLAKPNESREGQGSLKAVASINP